MHIREGQGGPGKVRRPWGQGGPRVHGANLGGTWKSWDLDGAQGPEETCLAVVRPLVFEPVPLVFSWAFGGQGCAKAKNYPKKPWSCFLSLQLPY